jgi:arginine N-succinyltransferase
MSVIIRPVQADDIESLMDLAAQTSFGLTTLPHDRPLLKRRIKESQRGFSRMADKPGGETYLFVMEDLDKGKVVGTAGIVSKVGGFEPFYSYRVVSTVAESKTLKVRKEIGALSGPCIWWRSTTAPPKSAACSCPRPRAKAPTAACFP